jgi:hypothetical protein
METDAHSAAAADRLLPPPLAPLGRARVAAAAMGDDDVPELDVSNDPTIEALGSEECTKYSQRHWRRLMEAADPAALVLSESREEDDKLYKVYAANFGGSFGLDLLNLSHAALHGGGTLETWRSVLTAMEGRSFAGQPMNMMTLLRADAHASYDPAETDLILVPRAQFLMIEIARNRQGVYAGLRAARLAAELSRATVALAAAMQQHDATRVLAALRALAAHRVVPEHVLKDTGAARLVGRLAKARASPPQWLSGDGSAAVREELGATASALRAQWKGGLALLALGEEQRAAAEDWLAACLALPALLGQRPPPPPPLQPQQHQQEQPEPQAAAEATAAAPTSDAAVANRLGSNIPPAAFSDATSAKSGGSDGGGDSIMVWCRMMPSSCVLCGVKGAVIENISYGAGEADVDHTAAAVWSSFECSSADPMPAGLLQWLHVAYTPAARLLLLEDENGSGAVRLQVVPTDATCNILRIAS